MQETWAWSLAWEDPLEKGKATSPVFWVTFTFFHTYLEFYMRAVSGMIYFFPLKHWIVSFSLVLIPLFFFCYYYAISKWDNFPPNNWSQIINMSLRAFLVAEMVKNLPAMCEAWVWSLGLGRSLGKGNDYPLSYSFLENPWTEKPGRLQSMGSQRLGHDWATNTFTFTLRRGRNRPKTWSVGKGCQWHGGQFSCSVVSDSLWPHELQHARPPCPSPTSGVHSNSCPSSRWCHPAISSSVIPFSSCP